MNWLALLLAMAVVQAGGARQNPIAPQQQQQVRPQDRGSITGFIVKMGTGQPVMNVAQTAGTNDLGEYRLFWLQPGKYFVSATPPEGQRGVLLNALAVAGPGIAGVIADAIGNRGGRGAAPVPPAAATSPNT